MSNKENSRAFKYMPTKLRDITGVRTETVKQHMDEWLSKIPDQSECARHAGCVAAKSNNPDQYQATRANAEPGSG